MLQPARVNEMPYNYGAEEEQSDRDKNVQNSFDLKMRVCVFTSFNGLLRSEPPWHHNVSILHDFENPFIQKESARNESFKFFKFISPSISTWV